MSTEIYDIATDFSNGVGVKPLAEEIDADATITTALLGVTSHEGSCSIDFDGDLSGAEKTALDAVVSAHDPAGLGPSKVAKDAAIDARTRQLIDAGFQHDGQTFSLSLNAQINWLGLEQKADDETYPMLIATKDDQPYSIADATAAHGIVQAAHDAKKSHILSGAALKAQVAAATTVAEVEAIADNR